jgi:putative FmdB family regulatory protein
MATYEYKCKDNNHIYTESRSMEEDQKMFECMDCGSELVRVFDATPTIFNGPGFYKTDSRK